MSITVDANGEETVFWTVPDRMHPRWIDTETFGFPTPSSQPQPYRHRYLVSVLDLVNKKLNAGTWLGGHHDKTDPYLFSNEWKLKRQDIDFTGHEEAPHERKENEHTCLLGLHTHV